ncbi:MAG: hypothetical protein TH68_04195 [Candidatus Synechococcus spongiarum 142]|uniref:Uncharacterized protein n=1 Tax=Candidatus Synechococcus spongiarum 142 TaxID=1608213 RepID=A0A6N3XCR1_9SYNE|nr:MAG: hypothetical protein TH68_04195 [Candidatus Synechococcus spongiarum 142]
MRQDRSCCEKPQLLLHCPGLAQHFAGVRCQAAGGLRCGQLTQVEGKQSGQANDRLLSLAQAGCRKGQ